MLDRGVIGMVCALAIAMVGCGSGNFEEAKKINDQLAGSLEEIVVALESVKSPEDASAAAARINEATSAMQATMTQAQGLKVTQSELDRLSEMQQDKVVELQTRLAVAAGKARSNSGNSPDLEQALTRFLAMSQSFANQ